MKENDKKPTHVCTNAFGDCDLCYHSIIYHTSLFGCMKCSCEEYRYRTQAMKTIVDGRHWGLDGRYSWSIRETDSPSGLVYYYWQVSRAAGAVIARGPASSLDDAKSRVHAVIRLMRVK